MISVQLPRTDQDKSSRCKDSSQLMVDDQQGYNENPEADTALTHEIDEALWKDAAFRAMDYENIDVRVSDGIVSLYGHVNSLTNLYRAERILQTIPGLSGINNDLIPDDRLAAEVAMALGSLEHTVGCKFFTGVSHGVVMLNGVVKDASVKLLAEKCAAQNPNVRGVINNVRTSGAGPGIQDQPFLQPTIGETIYFLDGISGVVRQVIVNPDNRRVVAMTVQGKFDDYPYELHSMSDGKDTSLGQLVVVPMNAVRYLTKVSGFLNIRSAERNRYMDFDPGHFLVPNKDWIPPYPYCQGDVLFQVEDQQPDKNFETVPSRAASRRKVEAQILSDELLVNDSLGG